MFWKFTCSIIFYLTVKPVIERPYCIPTFSSHSLRFYCLWAFSYVYCLNGASRVFFKIVSMYIQVAAKVEEAPNHLRNTLFIRYMLACDLYRVTLSGYLLHSICVALCMHLHMQYLAFFSLIQIQYHTVTDHILILDGNGVLTQFLWDTPAGTLLFALPPKSCDSSAFSLDFC